MFQIKKINETFLLIIVHADTPKRTKTALPFHQASEPISVAVRAVNDPLLLDSNIRADAALRIGKISLHVKEKVRTPLHGNMKVMVVLTILS